VKLRLVIAAILLLIGTLACRLTAPLVVSGTIADADGVPPALAFVALLSLEDYTLSASTTTTDGHYRLEAPGGQDYLLLAIPLSGEMAEGYNLHGHTPQLARIPAGSGDVTRDFTLIPCHDFILESYDAEGALILNDDWAGLRFVEDTAGNATDDAFTGWASRSRRTLCWLSGISARPTTSRRWALTRPTVRSTSTSARW